MTTIAEWLAAQASAAREKTMHTDTGNATWHLAQAKAYEAAHAYAVVRPDTEAELRRVADALKSPLADISSVVMAAENAIRGATFWSEQAYRLADELAANASPPPPAGTAGGGGSGDLGALSAEATPGRLYAQPYDPEDTQFGICLIAMPDDVPDGSTPTNGLVLVSTLMPSEMPIDDFSGDPRRAQANADFVKALWNAYRSGRLIEAPTPDLGAQGEPVATVVWYDPEAHFGEKKPHKIIDASLAFLDSAPLGTKLYDRPAPAAPRTGSGVPVDREAVREILGRLWCFAEGQAPDDTISDAGHTVLCATLGSLDPRITRRIDEHADLILALFAQAPRDGGETQSGVTLTDLHAANIARQAEWCPDQLPDLSFRGNELAGETGEACNVIKKLERERQGWRGSRATLGQLAEELADVVICADLCAVTAGINLDAAVREKFNATSEKVGLATKLPTPPSGVETIRQDNTHADAVTDADVEWLARKAIDTGDRTLARIAASLKVGRA